jgi:lipopolysaccharide/colanic/teichoic acid biosynthesis glycosyltransferase
VKTAAAQAAIVAVEPAAGAALPEAVQRAWAQADWNGYLPARASGFAWRAAQYVKRALDVSVAASLLLLLLPLFAVIALVIKATSPGPILYEWRVLGRRARPFVGYKFRTMVEDADARKPEMLASNEMRGPVFKMRQDPRVTRWGRWLRKYSLDELPQLWSVLVGDMSLVGPRPVYAEEFAGFEPWQWGKLAVTPGITCLWQIKGRSQISDFDEWASLDLQYIREWNLWLDLRILLLTIPAVARGEGAY